MALRLLFTAQCLMVMAALALPGMAYAAENRSMSMSIKIKLQQSGGYAALIGHASCEFDTQAMAAAEAEKLRALVRSSGLLESRQTVWKASQGADLITYVMSLEAGGRAYQFTFDELSIPDAAAPLLDYLLDHCP